MFQETESGIVIYYLAGSALMLLFIAAIITYAFRHQKKVFKIKQKIFDALQEGEERERSRLAEELHDGIGAKLAGLKMNLEFLQMNARVHQDLVAKIYQGVSETLEEVRLISHNLQPSFLNDQDIELLLQQYMEQLSASGECRYDLTVNQPFAGSVSIPVTLQVHRIITELLHNIHKHAHATLASVQIHIENSLLEVVVEDNGIGLNHSGGKPEGIGLKNIRSRVQLLKGTISFDSSEKGTSVVLEIPLTPLP